MLTARSLKRRLNAAVLARVAVAPAWIAAAAFAAWRLLLGVAVPLVAALCVAGALATVLVRFRRSAWTDSHALVALDRAAQAGGLALALAEREGPEWQDALRVKLATTLPPPLALARPLVVLALALGFAAVSALVPRPVSLILPIQAAALSHVEDAALKAAALKAEEKLDPALQAELERLKKEAESGRFDAADWAALDAVADALDQSAAERAGELASAEAAAQKLAQALDSKASDEATQRAKEELEAALMKLGQGESGEGSQAEGEGASEAAAAELAKAGELKSGADAKALGKALAARKAAMEKTCSGSGTFEKSGELASSEHSSQQKGYVHQHGEATGDSDQDGPAAPTSGPGAAPVTFGPQHPIDPDELRQQGLNKNGDGAPSELMGVRKAAPKPGAEGASATLGAAAAGPDGLVPGAAPLAPRHRELVKRYFEPKTGGKK